jgi:hypothetical protein
MGETLTKIRHLLYWDYEKDRWKTLGEDPKWDGHDELCEIDRILAEAGLGHPDDKTNR